MPKGRTTTLCIRLTPGEQQTLEQWQRSHTLPAGLMRRAWAESAVKTREEPAMIDAFHPPHRIHSNT